MPSSTVVNCHSAFNVPHFAIRELPNGFVIFVHVNIRDFHVCCKIAVSELSAMGNKRNSYSFDLYFWGFVERNCSHKCSQSGHFAAAFSISGCLQLF